MKSKRPVVLVPGIFGSILQNQHGEILWPCASRWEMWKIPFNMVRLWGTTDENGVFKGFSSDVVRPVAGLKGCSELIPGVESFYCCKRAIDLLLEMGYKENVTLFAFTYDFRHSALRLAEQLAVFLAKIPVKQPPILITHSIGSLLPRLIQHQDQQWRRLFSSQIAVAPTFDGGNGSGLLAVIDGYDLHFWFLRNVTRGLWCNSGMELGILQCSSGTGYQSYVCVTTDESLPREREDMLPSEAEALWSSVKLLQGKEMTVIEGILSRVLASPQLVRRDAYYWARRFAQFLRGGVSAPRFLLPAENTCYAEPGCCFRFQFQFFQLNKCNSACQPEETAVSAQHRLRSKHRTVRYGMWAIDCPKLGTRARTLKVPDRSRFVGIDLDNISASTYDRVSYHDYPALSQLQFETTLRQLPESELGNLIDLYQKIAPEGSLEGLIFGQNVQQHLQHYHMRNTPIQFADFKFASICGAGIPTEAHTVFKTPVTDEYALHIAQATHIMGDGDGTALLTTQLSDAVPEENVVSRHIVSGISHVGLMTNASVLAKLRVLVCEMQ